MLQQTQKLKIAITAGEPAGIGPDIILQLIQEKFAAELVIIGSKDLLYSRAAHLKIPINLPPFIIAKSNSATSFSIVDVPLAKPSFPGKLNPKNAAYVIKTLQLAAEGCLNKTFDAVVTAPVHKAVINEAGIPFSGHTEFFATASKVSEVVMMLVANSLRVALVTTHMPLMKVASVITSQKLEAVIRILNQALQKKFGILNPKITVAGLNPHAGESGQLGTEEITIITPILDKLRKEGLLLKGPLPADTLFLPQHLSETDAFLTMYHDQGLPVLKFYNFDEAVNITLGLPFIRTSVDHGTALELAGTGNASSKSLRKAILTAIDLCHDK